MYSTLWTKKPAHLEAFKGELVGDAFESWEVSPDKMQVTAKVSTKAHFVPNAPLNGRAVDARDIAYSWDKYKAVGALRSEVVNELTPDAPVVSMTAPDDRTVVIKLSQPDATLFGLLAQVRAGNFYVLPREAEQVDYRNKSIGSGPWMMKNWAPGSDGRPGAQPRLPPEQQRRRPPLPGRVALPGDAGLRHGRGAVRRRQRARLVQLHRAGAVAVDQAHRCPTC